MVEEEHVDVAAVELMPLLRGSATGVVSRDITRVIVLTKAHLRVENAECTFCKQNGHLTADCPKAKAAAGQGSC